MTDMDLRKRWEEVCERVFNLQLSVAPARITLVYTGRLVKDAHRAAMGGDYTSAVTWMERAANILSAIHRAMTRAPHARILNPKRWDGPFLI